MTALSTTIASRMELPGIRLRIEAEIIDSRFKNNELVIKLTRNMVDEISQVITQTFEDAMLEAVNP